MKAYIFFLLSLFIWAKDFSAEIINYTKFGFNNHTINEQNGAYPTDSFSTLYGSISYDRLFSNHLIFGAGIALGGIVFDSTKNHGDLAYKYLGYNRGFLGNQKATPSNTQNYFIKNLYIGYSGDNLDFKIGRFVLRNTDWLTGYHSAIELNYHNGFFQAYGLASIQKASYGGKWLKTFRPINPIGSASNYVPAVALGIKLRPENFLYHLFLQFQANRYFAPGLRFNYDFIIPLQDAQIKAKTDFITLVVLHTKEGREYISSYDMGLEPVFGAISAANPYLMGYKGRKAGWGGVSLGIKQSFLLKECNFGFQLYGNIADPNDLVGRHGNPIGIDLNDNSVYERGTANNALFDAQSFSGILFAGKKFDSFAIKFLGRITTSKRAFEESFSINTSYRFTKQTSLGINLSLYHVQTHAGFKIYHTYLTHARSDDRSFLSTYFVHKF